MGSSTSLKSSLHLLFRIFVYFSKSVIRNEFKALACSCQLYKYSDYQYPKALESDPEE